MMKLVANLDSTRTQALPSFPKVAGSSCECITELELSLGAAGSEQKRCNRGKGIADITRAPLSE